MAKKIMVMFNLPETGMRSLPAAYEEVLMMIAEGCTKRGWSTPSIGVMRVEQRDGRDAMAQMAWSVEVATADRGTLTLVFDAGAPAGAAFAPVTVALCGNPGAVVYMSDENGNVSQSRKVPIASMASLVHALQQWPLDLMDSMAQDERAKRQKGSV